MMHPDIAKTLVEQRHEQLAQCKRDQTQSKRERTGPGALGWLIHRVPRWRISWSRTVLSPAGAPGTTSGDGPDRPGKHGSSLVIIISAHRPA
jgi:hypothetical protein